MSDDIKCPYCHNWNEINHDDGYGYEEGKEFEQDCSNCGKEFKFFTAISFDYEVFCQPEDHDMEQPLDNSPDFFTCKNCEHSEIRR